MEQLVPHNVREQYKITTQTPLPHAEETKYKFQPEWEVEKSEKTIRQILRNYGYEPLKAKENRRLMQQIADERKLKLVYIDPK